MNQEQRIEALEEALSIMRAELDELKKRGQRFKPPTFEDVERYFWMKDASISATTIHQFYDHYESNGWKVGKNKMKNWKSAANGWISRMNNFKTTNNETTRAESLSNWGKDIFDGSH